MAGSSVTYSFNFKPDSLTIISSGNSTIPANKYARVTFNVSQGSTGSLDATVVVKAPTSSFNVLSKGAGNIWSTEQGTSNATVTAAEKNNIGALGLTPGSTSTTAYPVFTTVAAESTTNAVATYWVPTGTVVAVSGSDAQAVIEIYSA